MKKAKYQEGVYQVRLKVNIRNYPFAKRIKAKQRSFKQKSNGKYKRAYVKLNTQVIGTVYDVYCGGATVLDSGWKPKDRLRKKRSNKDGRLHDSLTMKTYSGMVYGRFKHEKFSNIVRLTLTWD